jgi:subtilase family serine protease
VRNRGNVSTGPFVVDVNIDGVRKDTVKHGPLPSATNFTAKSELARIKGCKPGTVRVVLDPQNVVGEFDEGNNVASAQLTPPCPDLVATISKDRMNNNLQYKAKVTVTNRGNLATPSKFIVLFHASATTILAPLPAHDQVHVDPLAPGQSFTFHELTKHTAATRMHYRAIVDFGEFIEESNETNNDVRATMGGL